MNKTFSEQRIHEHLETIRGIILLRLNELTEVSMPMLWRHFRWRFLGFWCFLWLYVSHQGIAYAFGTGVGILLVFHAVYHLYGCKCAINKAKEAIAYIEDDIRAHKESE